MTTMIDINAQTNIQINQELYKQFNVRRVIRDNIPVSKEHKTDLFLLGAAFQTCQINGMEYDFIIYNDVLRILYKE
jgi:hypothetical protein